MRDTVRYYITEANDRPVVRTVPVVIRFEPLIEQRSTGSDDGSVDKPERRGRRARLHSRLRSIRTSGDSA